MSTYDHGVIFSVLIKYRHFTEKGLIIDSSLANEKIEKWFCDVRIIKDMMWLQDFYLLAATINMKARCFTNKSRKKKRE
jgi:hypothetical protein